MEGTYPVTLGDRKIGSVNVTKQGLYYRFCCRCCLTGEVMFKLTATCGGQAVDLGVLIPAGDGFGLATMLPAKRLGEGKLTFSAVPKHSNDREMFIPIRPEEPFSYLSQLCDAYLAVRGGQVGAVIRDHRESSNPTGQ